MKVKYEYKKATIKDIDELVRTRIIVLRAANRLAGDVDMAEVECVMTDADMTVLLNELDALCEKFPIY